MPIDPYYGYYGVSEARKKSEDRLYSPYISPSERTPTMSTALGPANITSSGEIVVTQEGRPPVVVTEKELLEATTSGKTKDLLEEAVDKAKTVEAYAGAPNVMYQQYFPAEFEREKDIAFKQAMDAIRKQEFEARQQGLNVQYQIEGGVPVLYTSAPKTTGYAQAMLLEEKARAQSASIKEAELEAEKQGATFERLITNVPAGWQTYASFEKAPAPEIKKLDVLAKYGFGGNWQAVIPKNEKATPMPTPSPKGTFEEYKSKQEFGFGLGKGYSELSEKIYPAKSDYGYLELAPYGIKRFGAGVIGATELFGEAVLKANPIGAGIKVGEGFVELSKGFKEGAIRSGTLAATGKYEPAFKTALFGIVGTVAEFKGAIQPYRILGIGGTKSEVKFKVETFGEAEIRRNLGYSSKAPKDILFTKEVIFKKTGEEIVDIKPIIEPVTKLFGKYTRESELIRDTTVGAKTLFYQKNVESEGKISAKFGEAPKISPPEPFGDLLGIKSALEQAKKGETITFDLGRSTIEGGTALVPKGYKPLSTEAAALAPSLESITFDLRPSADILIREGQLFGVKGKGSSALSKNIRQTTGSGAIVSDVILAKFDIPKYSSQIITEPSRFFAREFGGYDFSIFKKGVQLYPIGISEIAQKVLGGKRFAELEAYPFEYTSRFIELKPKKPSGSPFVSGDISAVSSGRGGMIQLIRQKQATGAKTVSAILAKHRRTPITKSALQPIIAATADTVKITDYKPLTYADVMARIRPRKTTTKDEYEYIRYPQEFAPPQGITTFKSLTSFESKILVMPLTKNAVSERIIEKLKPSIKYFEGFKYKFGTDITPIITQKYREDTKQIQRQVQQYKEVEQLKQVQRFEQKQKQLQLITPQYTQGYKVRFPITQIPKIPKITIPPTVIGGKTKYPVLSKIAKAYIPEVRVKGKFKPLSATPLTLGRAILAGSRAVDVSTAATFRLKEAGYTTDEDTGYTESLLSKFYPKMEKKAGKVFIEKRRFRIDIGSESKQLQEAKRNKALRFIGIF